MYFLSWIVVGLITGCLTGRLLTGGGYGPIMDIVMGIAGALGVGSIVRLAGSPAQGGLFLTSLAAMFGAAIVSGVTAYANGNRRYVLATASTTGTPVRRTQC